MINKIGLGATIFYFNLFNKYLKSLDYNFEKIISYEDVIHYLKFWIKLKCFKRKNFSFCTRIIEIYFNIFYFIFHQKFLSSIFYVIFPRMNIYLRVNI